MTKDEARKLEDYHDNNYKVLVDDTAYMDTFVDGIYEDDDNGYVYNSDVFTERKLSEVNIEDVIVLEPKLNWRKEKPKYIEID